MFPLGRDYKIEDPRFASCAMRKTNRDKNEDHRENYLINMSKHSNTIREKDAVLWVNIALFGIVSLLFFYYVVVANSVAANSYKVQVLQDELESLVESNSSLVAQKMALESPTALLELARAQSLVAAGNIVYIFENTNVAQR